MWSWKERERTRKRGRRRTQILRHNGGDGKNEDKDWEEECVGVNFRWEKKMPQGLSAEYTHKQTYVNTAHRAPLPHSSFCHMTHKKKQQKKNKTQSPQATKHTRNSADRDTHIHAQTHTLTIWLHAQTLQCHLFATRGGWASKKQTRCMCMYVCAGRPVSLRSHQRQYTLSVFQLQSGDRVQDRLSSYQLFTPAL